MVDIEKDGIDFRHFPRPGHLVKQKVRVQHPAFQLIHHPFFKQPKAQGIDNPTLELALGQERIKHPTAVLNRNNLINCDPAQPFINRHFSKLHASH